METSTSTHSPLTALSLRATLALCAGTALFVMSNAAFAQVNPDVKVGTAEKMNPITLTDKGSHNPPAYKCGHNPPADVAARTGDTRMLLPAVKPGAQTKTQDAPQADTIACAKAK